MAPEPAGAAGDRVRAIGRKRLAPSSGPANSGLTLGAFQFVQRRAYRRRRVDRRTLPPGPPVARRSRSDWVVVSAPQGNARGWLGGHERSAPAAKVAFRGTCATPWLLVGVSGGQRRRCTRGCRHSAGCDRSRRRAPGGSGRRRRVARATRSSLPTTTSCCSRHRAGDRCGCRRCRSGPSAEPACPGAARPGVRRRDGRTRRVPGERAAAAKGSSDSLEHTPPVSPRPEVKERPEGAVDEARWVIELEIAHVALAEIERDPAAAAAVPA